MLGLRTIVIAGVTTVVAGTLIFGWSTMSSYIRTGASMAGDGVRDLVTTNFEIERLNTLVNDLDQTVADQRARLVKQQVDLDYLRREVEAAQSRALNLDQEVRSARNLLAVDRPTYVVAGRSFDRQRVISEAQSKAEALVRARSIAEAKQNTLDALTQALAQADEHISGATRQRETYALRLAELRANAEQVAMRQELVTTMGSLPGAFDRGAFQKVEDSFTRIERQIEVQSRLLDRGTQAPASLDTITFSAAPETDILSLLDRALKEDQEPASLPIEPMPTTDVGPGVASAMNHK